MSHDEDSMDYEVLCNEYPECSPDLIKRQIQLEEQMTATGCLKYQKAVEKARESSNESTTGYGRKILNHYLETFTAVIVKYLRDTIYSGKPGYNNSHFKKLENIEPETIAYIALRGVTNTISSHQTLQYVAKAISMELEDQAKCEHFRRHKGETYRYAMRRVVENTTYDRKHAALGAMLKHTAEGVYGNEPDPALAWKAWDVKACLSIGSKLIFMIRDSLGIVQVKMRGAKWRGVKVFLSK